MNGMFNWDPHEGQRIASPYLWVFFVVTLPVTALVYAAWWWWFRHTQQKFQDRHLDGISTIEKQLTMQVRSATNTW